MLMGLALLLSPWAALAEAPGEETPYTLSRTMVTKLRSADGHDYRVMIAWPDGAPPAAGWPALYMLDGDDNFAIAVQTARRLAAAGPRSGIEPGVVVGIDSGGLARRVLDYTPDARGYRIPAGAPASGLATGGADAFIAFLRTDVQPMVVSRWHVDPKRQTLAGHSFGGLVAIHSALAHPSAFSNYVAVSPSLWFGDGLMTREATAFAPPASGAARIVVAAGAHEGGPGGTGTEAARALTQRLAAKGVPARFVALGDYWHGMTMLAAMGEAVATALGGGRGQ